MRVVYICNIHSIDFHLIVNVIMSQTSLLKNSYIYITFMHHRLYPSAKSLYLIERMTINLNTFNLRIRKYWYRAESQNRFHTYYAYFLPTAAPARRSLTASANDRMADSVVFQSMQASVILTPFSQPSRPLAIFWLPSRMLDSTMTPMIPSSPWRSCSPMQFSTLTWLRWSFWELPSLQNPLVLCLKDGRRRY